MASFLCIESRVFPTLALTLDAGVVVDLPDDTTVTGLVLQPKSSKAAALAAPVTESGDNGAPTL